MTVDSLREILDHPTPEDEVIRLDAEQSRTFIEILLKPPPPNQALIDAMRLHRETVRSK
jgi:uncharacterized protein (DUF1778 family)